MKEVPVDTCNMLQLNENADKHAVVPERIMKNYAL
jgi:hypothetical protein